VVKSTGGDGESAQTLSHELETSHLFARHVELLDTSAMRRF
jgi:hypothetical protein